MKQYNGEKAIISLTSWKERINTVSKTLFSLLQYCPDFHIVLVLSEEEFPQKENELPTNLRLFIDNDLIEVLWIYKNYKAFKKVLFTMDKYRDVPVISADDDCIYKFNYAQMLYDAWLKDKDYFISVWGVKTLFTKKYNKKPILHTAGAGTLYPPYVFKKYGLLNLTDNVLNVTNQDDDYYTCLKILLNLRKGKVVGEWRKTYIFHNETKPLHSCKITNKNKLFEILYLQMQKITKK